MAREKFVRYVMIGFLSLMLAACAPVAASQETRPAITQTIVASETQVVSPTPEVSTTPKNNPTITATATPENTPTPKFTATPEAMTQAEIRAEILAAGVNLDDLANSRDEWTSSHKSIESIQNDIDSNFGSQEAGFLVTVVLDIEGVTNREEFDQALVTDGGWKILSYAKLAYKMANGDWQIIKVPLMAYSIMLTRGELSMVAEISPKAGLCPEIMGELTTNI